MNTGEVFYLMCQVGSDSPIWAYLKSLGGYHIVTGTSLQAIPSTDSEMEKISRLCSSVVFPPGIKRGLSGPKEVVDVRGLLEGKMASIVYVDKGAVLHWAGQRIDMFGEKFVRLVVEGTAVVSVERLSLVEVSDLVS